MARVAAGDAVRRPGLPVSSALLLIHREIQELRRRTSRPQVEPAAVQQQLHDLASQLGTLREMMAPGRAADPALDAFLRQLKDLLAHNLVTLQQQVAATAASAIAGPAESIRRDVASLKEIQASVDRRTQDTFEAVYGTVERIVERLAAIEDELQERSSGAPAAAASPRDEKAPAGAPDPAPGRPDESAVRPCSAPAASNPAPALAADSAGLMLRQPAVIPDVTVEADPARESVEPEPMAPEGALARMMAKLLSPRRKIAIFGLGAVMLLLVAVTFAFDLYRAPAEPSGNGIVAAGMAPDAGEADGERSRAAEVVADRPAARQNAGRGVIANPPRQLVPAGAAAAPEKPEATAATPAAAAAPWDADTLMQNLLPPRASRDPWPQSAASPWPDAAATPLPPAIGSKALAAAAQAGDPRACYEIAVRFMQGRNVTVDWAKAAAWMSRAAEAGLAPAQFRLGRMYEKGLGVRKNLTEARRLYMAAAAKGHAKAMHDLAVLYTRGIGGAPDWGAAAEWFRKAAAYGIVDSQYDLGILYARGAGVERDLAKSYKWFALAAKGGDRDAARKRDLVARGLTPKQLESAKASVEAFVAMPQPDEATAVNAPPGGWNQIAAAATTKSRTPGRTERFTGK